MSQIISAKTKCRCCGHKFDHKVLLSTNQFGVPDLDMRPPEMMRSTMDMWITVCPQCGFVGSDGDKRSKLYRDIVASDAYRTCDGNNFSEKLAADFYRRGLIELALNANEKAFHSFLSAAWVFDDLNDDVNSVICRRKALSAAEKLTAYPEEFVLILLDVYRRAGLFREIPEKLREHRFGNAMLAGIMRFQLDRAAEGDTACYTIDDAKNIKE